MKLSVLFCLVMSANIASVALSNDVFALEKTGVIVRNSGEVVAGREISNPSGPCIIVPENISNVRIENNKIGPCGKTVDGVGIDIRKGAQNVTITGNTIHDVSSGIYVSGAHHPIIIKGNTVYDVRGPMPRGQMVQFNNVSGGVGQSVIFGNRSDKFLSKHPTAYEDHISMYMSSGSQKFPILIACNKIRGGDSETGSGIMVGDYGGEWFSIHHNVLVLTSNTGIGIAGAKNVIVNNNSIWNRGEKRESKTSEAVSVFSYAGNIPSHVKIMFNNAVANSWVGAGDGSISEGLYDDKTGNYITYDNNYWQDNNVTSLVWNMDMTNCR